MDEAKPSLCDASISSIPMKRGRTPRKKNGAVCAALGGGDILVLE